jgi:peptide/nickel transport system permease protein
VLTRAASALLMATWSVPSFWLAVLLLLALASPSGLELFPLQGLGEGGLGSTLLHLVLPVTCLALPTLALATRQLASALEGVLRQDFIFAARARGIPAGRVYRVHALRNSLLPLVTMAGLSLPHLLGGSLVVERVFGIPGTGLLAFEAVGARDYPTVMGVATLMALATMLSMLLVDLLYGVIDPRIRLGAGS